MICLGTTNEVQSEEILFPAWATWELSPSFHLFGTGVQPSSFSLMGALAPYVWELCRSDAMRARTITMQFSVADLGHDQLQSICAEILGVNRRSIESGKPAVEPLRFWPAFDCPLSAFWRRSLTIRQMITAGMMPAKAKRM